MPVINGLPSGGLTDDDLMKINSNLNVPLDALISLYLSDENTEYSLPNLYNEIARSYYASSDADSSCPTVFQQTYNGASFTNKLDSITAMDYLNRVAVPDTTVLQSFNPRVNFIAPLNGHYKIIMSGSVSTGGSGVYVLSRTIDSTSGAPSRYRFGIIESGNGSIASCYAHAGEEIQVCFTGADTEWALNQIIVRYKPVGVSLTGAVIT